MKSQTIIFQTSAQPSLKPYVTDQPIRRSMRPVIHADGQSLPSFLRPVDASSESSDTDAQEKLLELATRSNQVLFQASAVFPFDFFPTEIVIDELKATIINRYFFGSERIQSIEIRDITQVQIETSPWFATLKIKHRSGELFRIPYLTKRDATEAHRIVQGLIIGERQHIEFANVQPALLKQTLQDIGKGKEDSTS